MRSNLLPLRGLRSKPTLRRLALLLVAISLTSAAAAKSTYWQLSAGLTGWWGANSWWSNGVPDPSADAYNLIPGSSAATNPQEYFYANSYTGDGSSLVNRGNLQINKNLTLLHTSTERSYFYSYGSNASTSVGYLGGSASVDYGSVFASNGGSMEMGLNSLSLRNESHLLAVSAGSFVHAGTNKATLEGRSYIGAEQGARLHLWATDLTTTESFIGAIGPGSHLAANIDGDSDVPDYGATVRNGRSSGIFSYQGASVKIGAKTFTSGTDSFIHSGDSGSKLYLVGLDVTIGETAGGSAQLFAYDGATLDISGGVTLNRGADANASNGTLVVNGFDGSATLKGSLLNHGIIGSYDRGSAIVRGTMVENHGRIQTFGSAQGGSMLRIIGTPYDGSTSRIVNASGGTFSPGGIIQAGSGGSLSIEGEAGTSFTNELGAQVLGYEGSKIDIAVPATNRSYFYAGKNSTFLLSDKSSSFSNFGLIDVFGDFAVSSSSTEQHGNIYVDPSGHATFEHAVNLYSGWIAVKGEASFNGGLTVFGGLLSGNGHVVGEVNNVGGTIAPGDPNVLTIDGSLTTASLIQLEIDGTAGAGLSGGYDQLLVSGNAALGGELRLFFGTGYAPKIGDTFDLIHAGSYSGSFASITTNLPSGYGFHWNPNGTGSVQAVPEPASFAALGVGAVALLRRRRRS